MKDSSVSARRRRADLLSPRRWFVAGLVVILLALSVCGLYVARRHTDPLGNLAIPGAGDHAAPAVPQTPPTPSVTSDGSPPAFVTTASPNGRYFMDQYGKPFLVKGDSPWSFLTRLSMADAELYFANRAGHGVNAVIQSLLGAGGNGAPSDDGSTLDGIRPFIGTDVTAFNDAYWKRAHDMLGLAAEHGITVFLYPVDAWSVGHSFVPKEVSQCETYGGLVHRAFADLPNVVWMSGGDYVPNSDSPSQGSDVDECVAAMLHGLRGAGDHRPFSIQIGYDGAFYTTQNGFWRDRVDFDWVYSYYPTYRAVLDAYTSKPTVPVVLGEANYERENNQPQSPPTTNQTLRRQVLWTLTSGATGDFYGSSDWSFPPSWMARLDSPGLLEVARMRAFFQRLSWWNLEPDVSSRFLTEGRGTSVGLTDRKDVLESDYATAAVSPDGSLAVAYIPTDRSFSVSLDAISPTAQGYWVDPSDGSLRPVDRSGAYRTPGANHDGDTDWLLVFSTQPLT